MVQLHRCLLEKALDISPDAIRDQKNVRYVRDMHEAMTQVREGQADVAFLMNPVRIQQVRDVAFAGDVLPQKSTDFYPKLLSGLRRMPWSNQRPASYKRPVLVLALIMSLSLLATLLVVGAADEKRVSVYSSAANYSLTVVERGGQDYVGLLETLEPLGGVSAKEAGNRWKLRYNNVDGEFTPGNARAGSRQ